MHAIRLKQDFLVFGRCYSYGAPYLSYCRFITTVILKLQFTRRSAYQFYSMVARAGFHIDVTSRRSRPIISVAYKASLMYAGGTRKPIQEIRHLAKIDSTEHLLLQRQLRWLGHVIRTPSNRLPRRLLYGELLSGQRPVGRPKLRYSDHIKSMLRKCNIPESNLENLAADRESWRSTCAAGLKNLSAASEQVASDCRARRHAASQATPAGPACPQCGRICASDFGLRSHLRSHRRPQN